MSAGFALAVLSTGWRRAPQRYLAAFLFLIALNQGSDMVWSLVAPDVSAQAFWFRVASVFAAVDPLILYYFASIYPTRNRLNRPVPIALVTAGAAVCAFATPFMLPEGTSVERTPVQLWLQAMLTTYTAVVYAVVLVTTIRGLASHPGERAPRVLALAMSVAALPLWPRAVVHVAAATISLGAGATAATAALVVVGFVGVILWGRRELRTRGATPDNVRAGTRALLIGAAIAVLLDLHRAQTLLSELGLVPYTPALLDLARVGGTLRWLIFGAAVSVAILRHRMLAMDVRARRRSSRVLVGATFLFVSAAVVSVLDATMGLGLRPADFVLVGMLVVASQGFRSLLDRVAWHTYGVPLPHDIVGREEAYRQAAFDVVQAGRAPNHDEALLRLRHELSLDDAAAHTLERIAESAAAGPLATGQLVNGRYRIDRLIGRGGGGRVFVAHDALLDRTVVVKEIEHGSDAATALREARIAGGLAAPSIVTVHDVLERKHASLLITEYVDGGTLQQKLDQDGPLQGVHAMRLLEGIVEGIAAVHARDLVHRDLKPANVLLTSDGRPKISDFGIARLRSGQTTMAPGAWTREGTPAFMAPEQVRGEPSTPATDVYALGLLARRALAPPLPAGVEAVVARALAVDPADRWPDAGAMLSALRSAIPEYEQGPADAHHVAMAKRSPFSFGELVEVDRGTVAASGNVLHDVRDAVEGDPAVFAADVGVEVKRDGDAAPPADDPLPRGSVRRRP